MSYIVLLLSVIVLILFVELFRKSRELRQLKNASLQIKKEQLDSITAENVGEPKTEASPEREIILIASEESEVLAELSAALADTYDIIQVSDGDEAMVLAKEQNPAIIIADMMLPVVAGIDLCRHLRGMIETSHIAVILFSSMYERENVIYALEAGADEFFTIPFDFEIMKARLRNILYRSQLLRDKVSAMNKETDQIDYKSQLDKEFMERVRKVIEEQMSNCEFTVNDFCSELAMSRSSVYNKLKTLTGNGPNDIIRVVRLNHARELLAQHRYTISEVAMKVGFADPKYFSTSFKKQFGTSPSKI